VLRHSFWGNLLECYTALVLIHILKGKIQEIKRAKKYFLIKRKPKNERKRCLDYLERKGSCKNGKQAQTMSQTHVLGTTRPGRTHGSWTKLQKFAWIIHICRFYTQS
jgi:hypothetical protein